MAAPFCNSLKIAFRFSTSKRGGTKNLKIQNIVQILKFD